MRRATLVAGMLVAALAAGCNANPGANEAEKPRESPSPSPSPTIQTPVPQPGSGEEEPMPSPPFKVRLEPGRPEGNVVVSGEGCSGEGAAVELYIYAADGTEVPLDPAQPNPDGTWEVRAALRKGQYRLTPRCFVAPRTLLVHYQPQEIKVP